MTIHLIGGDARQLYLADYISDRGFPVTCSFLGGTGLPQWDADIMILPLPATRDGINLNTPLAQETLPLAHIFKHFKGKQLFGGKLPPGAPGIDYYQAEEITLANAALTVEGALALAILHTPFALLRQPVLVLGAGRIGQLLALRLTALGARVTVAARRAESLALCRALGAEGRFFEDVPYQRFRLIFNTVPARVLPLDRLQEDTTLIELASAPGGFDAGEAQRLGLQVITAPGLPGKYTPESAAAFIGEFILKEMERLA
ncbi:MAG: dipicolinate synthase [Clostridia bacterium]|nr:dipicolinate synthase [Clostridia bacterium]